MNIHQWRQYMRFTNDQHMELCNPQEMWSENTRRNLHRITKNRSIWRLDGLLKDEKEKAVIIVGASPCLKKDVEKLKDLNKDYFLIIVVNSALKYLLKHGVKPDFVIAVDGNPKNIVNHLDCDNKDLTLITSNAVAPEIFDVWKGKEIWWEPYYSIDKRLRPAIRSRLGRNVYSGGNAFTAAVSIAIGVFDARMVIFVANECCYDEKYYVDKDSKWENPKLMTLNCTDILGRQRRTNLPLHQYKVWLEFLCDNFPFEVTFVDTSLGYLGTDSKSIHSVEISEAIKRVQDSFKTRERAKHSWQVREKLQYDAAYATDKYKARVGGEYWKNLFERFNLGKIKTILDVGCGLGQGIAISRNKGFKTFGIDISEGCKNYWDMANISQFCSVASADGLPFKDNHFDFVICTEVMEHIPEEGVLAALKEICRVGNHDFLLVIALSPSRFKFPHNGGEPHICLKSMDWWLEKLIESNFDIIGVNLNKLEANDGSNYTAESLTAMMVKGGIGDVKDGRVRSNNMHLQPKQKVCQRQYISKVESGVGLSA